MNVGRTALWLVALTVALLAVPIVRDWEANKRKLQYRWSGTVRTDGLTFHLNPEDRVMTPAMVRLGLWEPRETALVRSQLGPGDTFIDVGANFGYYTVIASKLVGETGRVIAFEPDPVSFRLLGRNVEANGCTNVVLVQKALSNQPGTIKLYLHETNKGAHTIYKIGKSDRFVKVEAVRLDDYLKSFEGDVNLIKIDTEGAEGAILEGARETLRRHDRLKLVMEFSPKHLATFGCDAGELLQGVQSLGFEIYDVDEHAREVLPVTAKELLARLPSDRFGYTNLFLKRRRPTTAESKVGRPPEVGPTNTRNPQSLQVQ